MSLDPSTAEFLRESVEGDTFHFWLGTVGEQGAPMFLLTDQFDDPRGDDLRRNVRRAVARAGTGDGRVGVGLRRPSGSLALSVRGAAEGMLEQLMAWARAHSEATAPGSPVPFSFIVEVADDGTPGAVHEDLDGWGTQTPPAHVDAAAAALTRSGGSECWFFLAGGAEGGLVLSPKSEDDSGSALAEAVKVLPGRPWTKPIYGSAQSAGGRWVFATTSEVKGAVEVLAGWAQRASGRHPGVRELVGANFLQLDEGGKAVKRESDDAAWAALAVGTGPKAKLIRSNDKLLGGKDGTRLWFWVGPDADGGLVLGLSPAEADPKRAKLSKFVRDATGTDGSGGVGGRGTLTGGVLSVSVPKGAKKAKTALDKLASTWGKYLPGYAHLGKASVSEGK